MLNCFLLGKPRCCWGTCCPKARTDLLFTLELSIPSFLYLPSGLHRHLELLTMWIVLFNLRLGANPFFFTFSLQVFAIPQMWRFGDIWNASVSGVGVPELNKMNPVEGWGRTPEVNEWVAGWMNGWQVSDRDLGLGNTYQKWLLSWDLKEEWVNEK